MDCQIRRPTTRKRVLPPLTDPHAADIAKALGHPARIRILHLLLEHGECYCGELCEEIDLAQSTVSQHLKVLKEARIVRSVACGRSIGYSVDVLRLKQFSGWLQDALGEPAHQDTR